MAEPAIVDLAGIRRSHVMGAVAVHALDGVTLRVNEGECVAVTGPSGCGKSTLLNVLGLLELPTQGSYHLAGQDVLALAPSMLARWRRAYIGFVFQQFHLLPHLSALANVALPLRYGNATAAEIDRQARAALDEVGLQDRATHRPDQLSGGQCQRVAIARALVGRPSRLLADEPTGALDSTSGAAVMETMLRLHRSHRMTMILVTHDLQLAGQLPRRIRMSDGRVVHDSACAVPHD